MVPSLYSQWCLISILDFLSLRGGLLFPSPAKPLQALPNQNVVGEFFIKESLGQNRVQQWEV
jgi:hypothetical protein